MKLPTVIKFPFAEPIQVREVGKSDPMIEGCEGAWDDFERVIYIRKSLGKQKKKRILYHELLHALHDTARQLEW